MRRRTRIDLGQEASAKDEDILNRKRLKWAERNKDRPDENPFLKAIRPDQEHYGDPEENADELRARLNNLEFGNFPGYFNYRNKAASSGDKNDDDTTNIDTQKSQTQIKTGNRSDGFESNSANHQPLKSGLTDDRLKNFKREWFEGKDVLDIGCNRGYITYAIARLYCPKSIIGVDIDLKMINMANNDLHLHLEEGVMKEARELRRKRAAKLLLEDGSTSSYLEHPNQFTFFSYVSNGPIMLTQSGSNSNQQTEDNSEFWFPNNIMFVEHNYVLAKDELVDKQEAHFDTIVCLSVTKWIHLNYRDDGLKRFFRRIYKHLRPDGLLVLEAQPFDNYGRRKKLSDRLRANYYSIQFKPDEFDAYLLSEQVGFKQIIHETMTEHKCVGFKRPLKVFLK